MEFRRVLFRSHDPGARGACADGTDACGTGASATEARAPGSRRHAAPPGTRRAGLPEHARSVADALDESPSSNAELAVPLTAPGPPPPPDRHAQPRTTPGRKRLVNNFYNP